MAGWGGNKKSTDADHRYGNRKDSKEEAQGYDHIIAFHCIFIGFDDILFDFLSERKWRRREQ